MPRSSASSGASRPGADYPSETKPGATSPSASPIWDLYVHQRTLLERHARANSEDVWNGRPISKVVLAEPLDVLDGTSVSLIELIPPVHQRVYRMGLEHLGVVVATARWASAREYPPSFVRPRHG